MKLPRRAALAVVFVLAGLGALAQARAHYPVLSPDAPRVEKGETVTVGCWVGHPFVDDRFPMARPTRVRVFNPLGVATDLTGKLERFGAPETPAWRVAFAPDKTGDWILSWQLQVFEPPQRRVTDHAKVVVHVGRDQVGWSRPLGDPLEIVPLTRPYGLPAGAAFRGQVLEEGRPMLGGVVEAETYHRGPLPDPLPELAAYRRAERTDPTGCFAIGLDRPGWWLLSVASDGGPGEQGGVPIVTRAALWVFVGDLPPPRR